MPNIGEILVCEGEPENSTDRYAVKVIKNGVIVGHLPKKISRSISLFLRREGIVTCRVTGKRCYSSHLPQGSLQIPCCLCFEGKKKYITKLIEANIDKMNFSTSFLLLFTPLLYSIILNDYDKRKIFFYNNE